MNGLFVFFRFAFWVKIGNFFFWNKKSGPESFFSWWSKWSTWDIHSKKKERKKNFHNHYIHFRHNLIYLLTLLTFNHHYYECFGKTKKGKIQLEIIIFWRWSIHKWHDGSKNIRISNFRIRMFLMMFETILTANVSKIVETNKSSYYSLLI